MKKIVNLSIISAFLLGLIFPAGAVFLSPISNYQAAQNLAQTAESKINIRVNPAGPSGTVVVSNYSAAAFAANCTGSLGASGDILQNAGLINLNQPAGCFTLKVSSSPNFQIAQLSVMPLHQVMPKVAVAYSGPIISSPNFSNAPVLPQTPVLPAVTLGLLIVLAVASRKIIFRSIKAGTASAKQALTLQQLQMLRC